MEPEKDIELFAAKDIFSLKGRQVLITGANGSFGRHFAKLLVNNGAKLVLASRNTEDLTSFYNQELRPYKDTIDIAALDITNTVF